MNDKATQCPRTVEINGSVIPYEIIDEVVVNWLNSTPNLCPNGHNALTTKCSMLQCNEKANPVQQPSQQQTVIPQVTLISQPSYSVTPIISQPVAGPL